MYRYSNPIVRALIALSLLVALLVGFAVPALAAPPAQTPAPVDLAGAVSAFLNLLIALAVGGGIAYILQMIPGWADWKSPFKPWIVVLLTAIVGGGLAALQVFATAEVFAQAPDWARAFIGFVVTFVGSQLTYQRGFAQWQS